jgi:3-deoxy-D-manno-octulosonate 8-phosphate phosphatase (KDO 8-P phosphatase)
MWIRDKARVCREIAENYGVPLDALAFLGDDIIDVGAMKNVGLGVAVADAMPEAKQAAGLVLDSTGGNGAVRELVHRLLAAQGRLDEAVKIYVDRKDHTQ